MKRFLVVLLSLGFIMAFSMSAFAVTGDVTGEYYAKGTYVNNPTLTDPAYDAKAHGSYAWYEARLQLVTTLKIVDGLKLSFRFTALETMWGANRKPYVATTDGSVAGAIPKGGTNSSDTQNIDLDRATLDFTTPIGQFIVGNQGFYTFGTEFYNDSKTRPGIRYIYQIKPVEIRAWTRIKAAGNLNQKIEPKLDAADTDNDAYGLSATAKFKGGDAGIQWEYTRWAAGRPEITTATPPVATTVASRYLRAISLINPYVRVKVGIVDIEAEAAWLSGDYTKFEDSAITAGAINQKADALNFGINAKVNLGPAYVGANFEYYSGDDPETTDKKEGGINGDLEYSKGQNYWGDFPGIMFTDQYYDYLPLKGNSTQVQVKDNLVYMEINGGFKASKQLDVAARFFIAKADKIKDTLTVNGPIANVSKDYGKEFDVKASYKIFDNLTYNVAAAYLWTGDFFKGPNTAYQLSNNYLLTHWLDLLF